MHEVLDRHTTTNYLKTFLKAFVETDELKAQLRGSDYWWKIMYLNTKKTVNKDEVKDLICQVLRYLCQQKMIVSS